MVTNRDRKSVGSRIAEKIPKVAQTTGTVVVFHPRSDTYISSEKSVLDFRIQPRRSLLFWDVAQFVLAVINVSGQPVGPIFNKGPIGYSET